MSSVKLSQQTTGAQSAKVSLSSSISTEVRHRASGFENVLDDVAMAKRQSTNLSQSISPDGVTGGLGDGGAQTSNTDIASSLEEMLQQMTSESNRRAVKQDQNSDTENSQASQLFSQLNQVPTETYIQTQIPGYPQKFPEDQKSNHQKSENSEKSYHASLNEASSGASPGSNVPTYRIDGVRTFLAVAGSATSGVASTPIAATTSLDPFAFSPPDMTQLAQAPSFRSSDIRSLDQKKTLKTSSAGLSDSTSTTDTTEIDNAEAKPAALSPTAKTKAAHGGAQGSSFHAPKVPFSFSASDQSPNSSADNLNFHPGHAAAARSAIASGSASQDPSNIVSSSDMTPTTSLTDLPALISTFASQTPTEDESAPSTPQGAPTVGAPPNAAAAVVRELDLSLHPEELGRLSVKLRSDSSGLAITIIAQRGEAARHLENQKDDIVRSLTSAGQVVSSVVVREESVSSSGNFIGQSSGGQQDNAGGGAKQQSWNSNNGSNGNTQSSQNGGDGQSGSDHQAVIDSDGGVARSSLGLVV